MNKYLQYIDKRFIEEMIPYQIYYNKNLKSWWWINPDDITWRFELDEFGTLYCDEEWGSLIRLTFSMDNDQFRDYVIKYLKNNFNFCPEVITYKVENFINTLQYSWIEETIKKGVKIK